MAGELAGKHVAILVADGFEQEEMTRPRDALREAGAKVTLIAPEADKVKGWQHTNWGDEFQVDRRLEDAKAEDFDALVLPGGVMNPDKLRRQTPVLRFVRAFYEAGKPIGAICHGPWTLIDAGIAAGKRLTSYESLEADLKNAGAEWTDEEVVVDHGLVTSRRPGDISAFNKKLVEEIAAGAHAGRH